MTIGSVTPEQKQVKAEDGLLLNFYQWSCKQPKAAVVISHGWSEHAGRYQDIAASLLESGFSVYAMDHRGHGKSEGKRGHVRRWSDYVRDLELLRSSVCEDKQYLIGHSMGGMISLHHLLEYPERFDAVALSGPAADVSIAVPLATRIVGNTMSWLMPRLSLSHSVESSVVCSDPKVVEDYELDPYNHGKVTARWFTEYLSAVDRLRENASKIKTPVAIWHGEGDELVEPWVSEQLFDRLLMPNKQRKVIPDALHEILLEPTWPETAKEMKNWLEQF
jgi:alpha-beta hydrolase superfamily lysophospholipase